MAYLPTLGWFRGVDVGKYCIHGVSGNGVSYTISIALWCLHCIDRDRLPLKKTPRLISAVCQNRARTGTVWAHTASTDLGGSKGWDLDGSSYMPSRFGNSWCNQSTVIWTRTSAGPQPEGTSNTRCKTGSTPKRWLIHSQEVVYGISTTYIPDTTHGTAIYATPLIPVAPPQLISKYGSPMECLI